MRLKFAGLQSAGNDFVAVATRGGELTVRSDGTEYDRAVIGTSG